MKVKSLLIIIFTLLIGFILGWLSSTYMNNRRLKEFRSYASYEGFKYHALEILNPTEEQKEKILPIIDEFSRNNLELKEKYREEFVRLMKDYRDELKPLLNEEQIQRLERRRRRGPPSGRYGRGRHQGGRQRDGSGPRQFP